VLVSWGGIDGFKEEQLNDPALAHGLATCAIDGPGVGDSPLKGSEDAERLFGAVFDWIGRMRPWTLIGLESGVTVLAVIGQSRLPIFTKTK
jgi:hypothetical protein